MNSRPAILCAALIFATVPIAAAADFPGQYKAADGSTVLKIETGDGGALKAVMGPPDGSQSINLTGTADGSKVTFTATHGTRTITMTGVLDGDQLTLTVNGDSMAFDRVAAKNAGPAVVAPAPVDRPVPGGSVLASNKSGRTLFFEVDAADDVAAAIRQIKPKLAEAVGGPVTVGKGFAEKDKPSVGGGSFTATVDGRSIEGTILVGKGKTGGVVTVVYAVADAPAADKAALMAAVPAPRDLKTYRLPDGSASIDLPPGWTTQCQSLLDAISLKGPHGEGVVFGQWYPVQNPDSAMQQRYLQGVAQMRAVGGIVSPPPWYVARAGKPVDAIADLWPQLDRVSRANGGPGLVIDKILESHDVQGNLPGSTSQEVEFLWTITENGQPTHLRETGEFTIVPDQQGGWTFYVTAMAAPVDRFDAESATLYAVVRSLNVDWERTRQLFVQRQQEIQNITDQQRRAAEENFDAIRKAHKDVMDAYAGYDKTWQAGQDAQSKASADYSEMMHGLRTIEDTNTGERHEADLGNVTRIVEEMNRTDPGRFIEVPLSRQ
jgi:hypothetical protein